MVPGWLDADKLPGKHRTLTGQTVEVTGSGPDLTVNGRSKVVCGNLQTKNATIYLIDKVLEPA